MADILKLYPLIKKWEGGFVNDPADAGGATNRGVTLATYKNYCKLKKRPVPTVEDLKAITEETVIDILRVYYWNPCKADDIENQSIANLIVNSVWGSGKGYLKKVQQVVGVKADGIVGPVTIAAINNADQQELFDKLWKRRKKFFEDIAANSVAAYEKKVGRKSTEAEQLKYTNRRFLKGWLNRLADFQFAK
ncbi:MAG: peptidoglycan domain protein [Bacteroidales bacterium]|nr:peptidoglycan domain protein [Bacteroidales bacterium]